jgi:hypothetical protein
MRIRSALGAPFRLAIPDLFAAIAIAIIALSFIAGPVFAQDASPSPVPPAVVEVTNTPAASLATSLSPAPSSSTSLVPGASPSHSLPPGGSVDGDPCGPSVFCTQFGLECVPSIHSQEVRAESPS